MVELPKSMTEALAAGTQHYFTGTPCLNNHLSRRSAHSGNCLECQAIWRTAHRDSEKRKKYYDENKVQENLNSKIYYATHRDKRRSDAREHRKLNAGRLREKRAEWRRNNPEYGSEHRKHNKDKYSVYAENRRCRLQTGRLSLDIIAKLLELQNSKCAICSRPLKSKYHLDHIIPLVAGGSNTDSNVQLTHPTCNYQKGQQLPEEFMRTLGRLL